MNNYTVQSNYIELSSLKNIRIADSFVISTNKIGAGNGESKLYIGRDRGEFESFFGDSIFHENAFLLKVDLLQYLADAEIEYLEPSQDYRSKDALEHLYEERRNKISTKSPYLHFTITDQNQIDGDRRYISSTEENYQLLRELPLPKFSYLEIYKLKNRDDDGISFYFKLLFDTSLIEERAFEKEIRNDNTIISVPFDPNKIKVRTLPTTIGQIIDDLQYDVINLDTEFQRLPNLWDNSKKSRFIESILLKLPIPAFYFNEQEENNLEVVDGLQRISTIKSFVIDKNFKLEKLEFLKEYNGYSFDSLPPIFSRRIKTFPITTYIIEKGTPEEVKFNIFKRVNTGGLILTPQEIRHAINSGKPASLIAELVRAEAVKKTKNGEVKTLAATKEGIAFVKATDNRIGSFRMEDRDFATRFVAFYLIPYTQYEPDLDTFLNKGMHRIRDLSETEIDSLKSNFTASMDLAYTIFGNDAFRKRFHIFDSRKPINKALFETLSVSFAKLTANERLKLAEKKDIFKLKFIEIHNFSDGKFARSISQGTAQTESVNQRFKSILKIINETLND